MCSKQMRLYGALFAVPAVELRLKAARLLVPDMYQARMQAGAGRAMMNHSLAVLVSLFLVRMAKWVPSRRVCTSSRCTTVRYSGQLQVSFWVSLMPANSWALIS